MRARLGLLVVGFSALLMIAGSQQQPISEPVLSQWRFTSADTTVLDAVAARYELVARVDKTFDVIVPQSETDAFTKLVPQATLMTADLSAAIKGLATIDPTWLASYRSFSEVEQVLRDYAEAYPEIITLQTYGESAGGLPLYALKLSDQAATDEEEPEIMLTAATHGDELITVEVVLHLLEELVQGYGKDQRLTSMVDDNEIYILPVINPDGFSRQSRYASGIDPNRDYPYPDSPNRNSVQCIANVIEFFHGRDIKGSLDFHASGKLVMYPWAYTRDPTEPDVQRIFSNLGRDMADDNGYTAGQISRVIYVARGSSADYYHWKTGALSFGIELADSKVPHPSRIPHVVTEAREMTWKFIESF